MIILLCESTLYIDDKDHREEVHRVANKTDGLSAEIGGNKVIIKYL